MKKTALLNGRIAARSDLPGAREGIFETMLVRNRKCPLIERHFKRISGSAKALKMACPFELHDIKNGVAELSEELGKMHARCRLSLEPGGWFMAFDDLPARKSSFSCRLGRAAETIEYSHKFADRGHFDRESALAREDGLDESILVDSEGVVREGAVTSVFIVKNGGIASPPLSLGILPGVARGLVVELARLEKIKVEERIITRDELMNADEVFLTNALRGVIPVSEVDGKKAKSFDLRLTNRILIRYNRFIGADVI